MKRPFTNKPPTTYAQQVTLLQQRGMQVDDPVTAEFYLKHLNCYRLGAYWLPCEADHVTHAFRPGTRFDDASKARNLHARVSRLRIRCHRPHHLQ
jgi:abortive infection bacteriophage resistance protein